VQAFLQSGDLSRAETVIKTQKATIDQLTAVAQEAKSHAADAPAADQATAQASAGGAQDALATATKTSATSAQQFSTASGNAGCGGKSAFCLFGGAFLAGYSLTTGAGDRQGETGHHIVQLALPTAGIRYAALQYASLDLGFYTAIISPQFQVNQVNSSGSGCATKGGTFENSLPCEGDAPLRPYAALFLGATIGTGSSSLGLVSIGWTVGGARTDQDPNLFWFSGLMITTGGIFATAPLGNSQ
jgi:hypothetical protein